MNDSPRALNDPFQIVSLLRAEPPAGGDGSEWYRYVISQGSNTIRGCRRGSLAAVTTEVEGIITRLNERRALKPGRTHVILRSKKPSVG